MSDTPPETPELEGTSLRWANAILFAVRHIDYETLPQVKPKRGRPRKKKPGEPDEPECPPDVDPIAFSLWQYGRSNLKCKSDLVSRMMFRALAIIDQNKTPGLDDVALAAEEKEIAEMESLLEAAIEEAKTTEA